MLDTQQQRQVHTLTTQRNLLAVLVAVSLMACAAQSVALMTKRTHVILLPSTTTEVMEFHGTTVSETYLARIGLDVVSLVMNRTPRQASKIKDLAIIYAHPDAFGEISVQLDAMADQARRRGISTSFAVSRHDVDAKALTYAATGILRTYLGEQMVSSEEVMTTLHFALLPNGQLGWVGFDLEREQQ